MEHTYLLKVQMYPPPRDFINIFLSMFTTVLSLNESRPKYEIGRTCTRTCPDSDKTQCDRAYACKLIAKVQIIKFPLCFRSVECVL